MLVTLNMTCWDRLDYTKLAIQSVLTQSYNDFELVIVDNGSQDGTPEYLKTLTDPRVKIILKEENTGLNEATNEVFKASEAKYLGRVDNDTIVPMDWLERLVKAHETYDNFGFIGGFHFDRQNIEGITPRITNYYGVELWHKPYIGGCSFLIKNEDYKKFGEIPSGEFFKSKVLGLTDYQIEFDKAGKKNGYIWSPPIWVEHMEHIRAPHNICNEKYDVYTSRVRGVGVRDYSSYFDESSKHYLSINTK